MPTDNPLFVGHYPGDRPLYKKPEQNLDLGVSYENDLMATDDFFNSISAEINSIIPTPRWFIENIKKDFQNSFKLSVRPAGTSIVELGRFEEETLADYPGAFAISINANPLLWAKDPTGMAKKTAKSWFDKIINYSDLQNEQYQKVFKHVITDPSTTSTLSKTGQKAVEAIENRRVHQFGNGNSAVPLGTVRPLSLESFGEATIGGVKVPLAMDKVSSASLEKDHLVPVYTDENGNPGFRLLKRADLQPGEDTSTLKEYTPYSKTRGDILTFISYSNAPSVSREGKFDIMLKSAFTDLQLDWNSQLDLSARDPNLANTLKDQFANDPEAQAAYNHFFKKFELTNSIEALGMAKARKNFAPQAVGAAKTEGSKRAEKLKLLKAIDKQADATQKLYQDLLSDPTIEIDKIISKKDRKLLESYITRLKSFSNKYGNPNDRNFDASVLDGKNSVVLLNELDGILNQTVLGKSLTGGDLFRRSLNRRMLRQLQEDLNTYDEHFGKYTQGGRKLNILFNSLELERDNGALDELGNNLRGDKVLDNYLWPYVNRKIQKLTPAYWMEQYVMPRVGMITGLKYDDDLADKGFLGVFGKAYKDGQGIFANKFNVGVNLANGTRITANVFGGDHFKFPQQLSNLIQEGDITEEAAKYLLSLGNLKLINEIRQGDNITLETTDHLKRLYELNDGKLLPFETLEQINKLDKQRLLFDEWMKDHRDLFPDVSDAEFYSAEFRLKLMKELRIIDKKDDYLSITTKAAGLLDQVYVKLNLFQTWLLERKGPIGFVMKNLRDVINTGTIIREKVYDFLVNKVGKYIMAALLTSASGGALAPFSKALVEVFSRVGKFFARKIAAATTDVLARTAKGIWDGDISQIFSGVDEGLDRFFKITVAIIMIPFLIIFMFVTMFISGPSTSNEALSVGDPSIYNGNGSGGGIVNPCEEESIPADQLHGTFRDSCKVIWGSLNLDTETGHGSNAYWDVVSAFTSVCTYYIPGSAIAGSEWSAVGSSALDPPPLNVCRNYSPKSTAYGYALDLGMVDYTNDCRTVYMPVVDGISEWTFAGTVNSGKSGNGIMFEGTKGSTEYRIAFLHLASGTVTSYGTVAPGDKVGDLYFWDGGSIDNSHVHIEMSKRISATQWQPIKPETEVTCN